MRLRAKDCRAACKSEIRHLPRKALLAVAPSRRFPLDEPAAGPLRANASQEHAPAAATAPASRWPVLARIAELNRASEVASPAAPTPPRTTYRVDAPHAAAAPVQASAPKGAGSSVAPRVVASLPASSSTATAIPPSQDRILRAAPLPIRVALEAWHWIQPYQKLLRLAAMITLMSAGGMAMVMMMNERQQPAAPPTSPATTAVDKTSGPELEIQHAELDRTLVPTTGPAAEIDTDTLEPTAAGPLPPQTEPLMAVEKDEPVPALPYPTTLRPESLDTIIANGLLPQAKFEEPAVARLKGTVEEALVR